MKTQIRVKSEMKPRRIFSETVRREVVKEIEKGRLSVVQACRDYAVSSGAVYKWIYRYSRYLNKNKLMVVEDKSESGKNLELQKRIKELEAALGRKQLEVDFLNKVIELTEKEYHIDIKKKDTKKPLDGSAPTK